MRLAVAVTSPYGGLLHYAAQLADGLALRGHDVDLLAPRGNELVGRTSAARMRDVLVPPVAGHEQPTGAVRYAFKRAGVAARLIAAWGQLLREGRSNRYDAFLVSSDIALAPPAAALLALALLPRRAALAVVCHNVRIFNRWQGDELFRERPHLLWLFRKLYPRLDVVFVHGDRSRREFEDFWPASRLAVIPHGDESIFGDPPPPSEEERLLFFGDWVKVKGLDLLMAAFDQLVERRPDARLTIAGTPMPNDSDPDVVRAWAAGHGERVRVIDRYVPLEEVRELFASARAVVTAYRTASQSGVVHLAMTMGRAVVATDVGDLAAAVGDGEGGIVIPPQDLPALVDALERVLADRELAERLGRGARERVTAAASWERVAEQAETALAEAVARR